MSTTAAAIQRLPEEVVNRIAAGEVVQRPSAALKELIENSLDAGSTSVAVSAQDGGLEVLQVSDDGVGVRYADLPLLCERYATSKLRVFEDLQRISSFGFRGEALASVSYVSRVIVTTRRRCDPAESANKSLEEAQGDGNDGRVAWRCFYMDGRLTEPPQPCAGNCGTVIRSEKMFHNTPVRRAALKAGEEWRRLLDVVSRYALAFPHVGFSCQKEGTSASGAKDGLVFPRNSTTLDNIRLLLGNKVASHLRFIYYYNAELPQEDTAAHGGEEALPHQRTEDANDSDGELVGRSLSSLVNATGGSTADSDDRGCGQPTKPSPLLQTSGSGPLPSGDRGTASAAASSSSLPSSTGLSPGVGGDGGSGDDRPNDDSRNNPARRRKVEKQQSVVSRVRAAAQLTQGLSGGSGEGRYTIMGYASDATLLYRKPFLALFVNGRLVESATVRRAIDAVYSSVLTGGNRPVVVLFLTVPADRLDVNVHPTKKEVCFLDEELVLGRLAELIRAALVEAAAERQVDVTSLGKSTTLALQATVRYQDGTGGGSSGPRQSGAPGEGTESSDNSSAVRGVWSFRMQQQQQQSLKGSSGGGTAGGRSASGSFIGNGGTSTGVVVAPCTMVRVEPQRGALDAFLSPLPLPSQPPPTQASRPAEATINGKEATAKDRDDEGEGVVDAPVDWAAVLASVRPVMDPEGTSMAEALPSLQRAAREDDDDAERGHEVRRGRHPTAAVKEEAPSSLLKRELSSIEGGEGDDSVDEDLEDAMREFKRFRGDGEKGEELPVNHHESVVPHQFAPHLLVLDDEEETSNSVQIVEAGSSAKGGGAAAAAAEALLLADGVDAGGGMVGVTQLEDYVLSSVANLVDSLATRTSSTAQALVDSLSFVGVCEGGNMFLAQSGTSLLAVDTLRLVREVVFQRIFLRWAQPSLPKPPLVTLVKSHKGSRQHEERHHVKVYDALLFALYHDGRDTGTFLTGASPLVKVLKAALADTTKPAHLEAAEVRAAPPLPSQGPTESGKANADANRALSPLEVKLLSRIPALLFRHNEGAASAQPQPPPSSLSSTPEPTDRCHRYVRGLVRRLDRWREMLEEYFSICLTSQGYLIALPCGLNTAWPPSVRAIPLFLWLLAETVPFPDSTAVAELERENDAFNDHNLLDQAEAQVEAERRCFERVARLIADVLYGLSTAHLASPSPLRDEDGGEELVEQAAQGGGEAASTATGQLRKQRGQAQRAALGKAIQFGLVPCLKNRKLFLPPDGLLSNGTVQSIVTVESLYKVFERC